MYCIRNNSVGIERLSAAIIVLTIFIGTLIVIMSERIDETATALFGMSLAGVVLYVYEGISFESFIGLIQWDSILFIAAMLIVVAVAASSGMFQYIALVLVKRTGDNPRKMYLVFMGFVFIISLFLDPLPTMLVMGSFTVEVCRALEIRVKPFLVSEVIVCNFASLPTIVGSVPNLVIAVLTEIDAGLLFITLFPLSVLLLFITIPILLRIFKEDFDACVDSDTNLLFLIQPRIMIRSRHDFYLSVIAMIILISGFTASPQLGIEVSMVALAVASGMLVFSQKRAKELIRQLSWDIIFFLIGLFGLIVALTETGLVDMLAGGLSVITGGNIFIAIFFLIWIPGLALSVIDNIPVAAVLSPLAIEFSNLNRIVPLTLVIGANVGGYAIPFGDAPNMIAASLSAENGEPLSFIEFTKIILPIAILHLVISTVYSFIVAILFA